MKQISIILIVFLLVATVVIADSNVEVENEILIVKTDDKITISDSFNEIQYNLSDNNVVKQDWNFSIDCDDTGVECDFDSAQSFVTYDKLIKGMNESMSNFKPSFVCNQATADCTSVQKSLDGCNAERNDFRKEVDGIRRNLTDTKGDLTNCNNQVANYRAKEQANLEEEEDEGFIDTIKSLWWLWIALIVIVAIIWRDKIKDFIQQEEPVNQNEILQEAQPQQQYQQPVQQPTYQPMYQQPPQYDYGVMPQQHYQQPTYDDGMSHRQVAQEMQQRQQVIDQQFNQPLKRNVDDIINDVVTKNDR